MLLRLFLFAFMLYMGYRFAKRVANYFLGPPPDRQPDLVQKKREVRQRPPEVEDARWEDVTPR